VSKNLQKSDDDDDEPTAVTLPSTTNPLPSLKYADLLTTRQTH
jgi:hypothetical protein